MWESRVLGFDHPEALLRAVFVTIGLHFSLGEGGGRSTMNWKWISLHGFLKKDILYMSRMVSRTIKDAFLIVGKTTKLCVCMQNLHQRDILCVFSMHASPNCLKIPRFLSSVVVTGLQLTQLIHGTREFVLVLIHWRKCERAVYLFGTQIIVLGLLLLHEYLL